MSHDAHESHPAYSPAQVLKDGCSECGVRSRNIALAVSHMDADTFARAWERAMVSGSRGLDDISEAEVPLLNALFAIQMQLLAHGLPVVAVLPRLEVLA